MKRISAFILALLLVTGLAACGANEPVDRKDPEVPEVSENPEEGEQNEKPVKTGERIEVSSDGFENAVEIVLSENGVTVDGKPAEESDCVTVGGEIIYYHDMDYYESGNTYGDGDDDDKHTEAEAAEHTLVTITKAGEYFVKGEIKGQLAVDLGEEAESDPNAKVTLIFGGAEITCEIAPAVIFYNVYECADTEEPSGNVDTSKAGANVIIADGSESIIRGANVAKIYKDNGEEKKLHKYDAAFYSKKSMNIDGGIGILNIIAENEGLGTEMHLTINGGNINIDSQDDGINTNEDGVSVTTVNGGTLTVNGGLGVEGDGIDSNGWLTINGGTLYAYANNRSGDGGIDADMGITINGGTVAAFGSRNDSVQKDSAQLFVQLSFSSEREAGSLVEFVDAEGNGISVEAQRGFQSVVLSGKNLVEGKEYSLYVNGVLQEYSSNVDPMEFVFGENGIINEGLAGIISNGGEIVKENPYAVPEGLEEWLESEKDMPDEIREWVETMVEVSERFGAMGGFMNGVGQGKGEPENGQNPAGQNPGGQTPGGNVPEMPQGGQSVALEPEGETDMTVFVITDDTYYFSGVCDSAKATGKERVNFTINGENRIENIFKGDLPGIKSIECSEEIAPEDIQLTLIYSGRSEEITVSRTCLLSEGYEAVNALFEELEAGDYRLTVAVVAENEKYTGSTIFNFDVVD